MRTIRCDAPDCRSYVEFGPAAGHKLDVPAELRARGWACVRLADDARERHLCPHHSRAPRPKPEGGAW